MVVLYALRAKEDRKHEHQVKYDRYTRQPGVIVISDIGFINTDKIEYIEYYRKKGQSRRGLVLGITESVTAALFFVN
jgi:hypothetical protein